MLPNAMGYKKDNSYLLVRVIGVLSLAHLHVEHGLPGTFATQDIMQLK